MRVVDRKGKLNYDADLSVWTNSNSFTSWFLLLLKRWKHCDFINISTMFVNTNIEFLLKNMKFILWLTSTFLVWSFYIHLFLVKRISVQVLSLFIYLFVLKYLLNYIKLNFILSSCILCVFYLFISILFIYLFIHLIFLFVWKFIK